MAADLELVSFDEDPAIREVVSASARFAKRLRAQDESRTSQSGDLQAAAHQLKTLQLVDLLTANVDVFRPESLLFHIASLFGGTNLTSGWQGLAGVPAAVALNLAGHHLENAECPLAFPIEGRKCWLLLSPVTSPTTSERVWLLDGDDLMGPGEIPAASLCSRLPGFPHGGTITIESAVRRRWPSFTLTAAARSRLFCSCYALMTGLLNGALRRTVEEAYGYARIRSSAGKPISQHQAVALRLADLALHQQALALYLQAAVEEPGQVGCDEGVHGINVDYVTDSTARISRDAVQIAGGHGYVEGLPFKKLFEQTRTLTSSIAMMSNAFRPAAFRTPATSIPCAQ